MRIIKCVAVGDAAVGKVWPQNCLLCCHWERPYLTLPPDLSPKFIHHGKQVRVCPNSKSLLYRRICRAFFNCLSVQVFNSYAIPVMVGDELYGLGLIDTDGE